MASFGDALGGRLPLTERPALSGPQQQLYDRMTKSVVPRGDRAGCASQAGDGRFTGPVNPALQSPVNPDGTTTAWNKNRTKVLHGHGPPARAG